MNRTASARAVSLDDDGPAMGAVEEARRAPAGSIQPAVTERLWVFLDEEGDERPARGALPPAQRQTLPEPWSALLAAGVRVVPHLGK